MKYDININLGGWEFSNCSYDGDADVMYLSVGPPREGYGEETPEGHLLRFDKSGDFYGVTLLDVKRTIEDEGQLTVTVPTEGDGRRAYTLFLDLAAFQDLPDEGQKFIRIVSSSHPGFRKSLLGLIAEVTASYDHGQILEVLVDGRLNAVLSWKDGTRWETATQDEIAALRDRRLVTG